MPSTTYRLIELAATCVVSFALSGLGVAHGQEPETSTPDVGERQATGRDAIQDPASEGDDDRPWFRGVSRDQRMAAREHFRAGNKHLRDGLFAPAAEEYKQALALWQHPAFFYNLTITQLSLVQPIEAHKSILKALEHGAAGLGDDKHERALEYKKRLEKQLAKVVIRCDEPGVQVTLDGRPIQLVAGRYEQVMLPGSHQVYAKKEQRIPEDRPVVVSSGEEIQIDLVLGIPDKVETVRYMPAWIPWTALGLSAAVLGGAGYLDWRSSQDLTSFDADFNSQCRRGCLDFEVGDLTQRLQDAESDKRTAIGLYIAGGVMVVGSAVLVLINGERIKRTKVERKTFSVAPIVAPDTTGLVAALRF